MIEVRVPDEQEGTKAVVRAWLKQVGDPVAENDPLVELETDKVTQEVPAPAAGVLTEILLDTDDEAEPGALARPDFRCGRRSPLPSRRQSSRTRASAGRALAAAAGLRQGTSTETRLSPSVQRALLQHNIDPSANPGHGPRRAHYARRCRPGRGVATTVAPASRRPQRHGTSPAATFRMTGCGSRSPRIWSARSARRRTSPRCSKPISRPSPRTRRRWRPRASSSATPPIWSKPPPRRWRSRRRSTDGGKRTGSPFRRRSTSASAPRLARRGWWSRSSRTPARSASRRSAASSTT